MRELDLLVSDSSKPPWRRVLDVVNLNLFLKVSAI